MDQCWEGRWEGNNIIFTFTTYYTVLDFLADGDLEKHSVVCYYHYPLFGKHLCSGSNNNVARNTCWAGCKSLFSKQCVVVAITAQLQHILRGKYEIELAQHYCVDVCL